MGERPGRYRRPMINLTWEDDTEFAGLHVRCRRISCAETFEFDRARAAVVEHPEYSHRDYWEPVQRLLSGELMAECGIADPVIVEWNLDDYRGEPVPVTVAGLQSQDLRLTIEISTQLIRAVTGVPGPLPQPSTSEDLEMEASIPMSTADLGDGESLSKPTGQE